MARMGTVYLVGAGPGDPELITVRGLRLLREADVVIHDRLITKQLIDEAPESAEIIDVGKHPGFQRYTQDEINDLLVERAHRGCDVVRLKGGDPYVFGRGSEEVHACQKAHVPVIVVPGISSAHAVPAATGIPLTHRGMSRSYAVITGQTDPASGPVDIPYHALVDIDTIIILMGRDNLREVTTELITAGRPGDTPAACVESGCTPEQRVIIGTLETIADRADQARLHAPVVTVVGTVVSFACETPTTAAIAAALEILHLG